MDPKHIHKFEIRQVQFEGFTIKVLWTCYHGDELYSQWEYFTIDAPAH